MRCDDFQELIDSFLNDELLVETNHEAIRHLEICESCREQFEAGQLFREKLRTAVRKAPEMQVAPAFALNLRSALKRESAPNSFWQNVFSLRILAPAAALLLIAVTVGIVSLAKFSPRNTETADSRRAPNDELVAMWEKISDQAIGDHKDCGLKKMQLWQSLADQETEPRAEFRKTVLEKMDFGAPEKVNLLQVHDCYHDGRLFSHAIILIGDRTVSILFTKTETSKNANSETELQITSRQQSGFQVASFSEPDRAVFVISDLSESQNLSLARSLSKVMQS